MHRIALIFVLFSAVGMVFVPSAEAARKAHRPWLMIGGTPEAKETEVLALSSRSSRPGDKVAQQALRYKGTKYRFGGTNKKGIDCSGLVRRVYEDLKMKRLPHASASLYNSGKPIRLAELRPGDLVFFKNTYKRGISHVGVYAGSNKFVHAANRKRGVTVTKLSDPYYQIHYAGARRLY